jgi:hypothetical protein
LINYRRERKSTKLKGIREFDDIIALDIKDIEWTVEDQLQAKTVNANGGDNGDDGDSELLELNSSEFKDIKL